MSDKITLHLSKDEALVVFDFFTRFRDTGSFRLRHNAEFIAFSNLSMQLQETLVEPFSPQYAQLLKSARDRIADGWEGVAPGVVE